MWDGGKIGCMQSFLYRDQRGLGVGQVGEYAIGKSGKMNDSFEVEPHGGVCEYV